MADSSTKPRTKKAPAKKKPVTRKPPVKGKAPAKKPVKKKAPAKKSVEKIDLAKLKEVCNGLSHNTIYADVRRGNLIRGDDKLFDMTLEVNKAYVKRKQTIDDRTKSDKYDLEKQKRRLEVEKAQEDLEFSRIRRQKLAGDVIPTDLVFTAIAVGFKAITQAYHDAADQMVIDWTAKTRTSQKRKAEMRGALVDTINKAVDKSQELLKDEIKNIVADYSQADGRGGRR